MRFSLLYAVCAFSFFQLNNGDHASDIERIIRKRFPTQVMKCFFNDKNCSDYHCEIIQRYVKLVQEKSQKSSVDETFVTPANLKEKHYIITGQKVTNALELTEEQVIEDAQLFHLAHRSKGSELTSFEKEMLEKGALKEYEREIKIDQKADASLIENNYDY